MNVSTRKNDDTGYMRLFIVVAQTISVRKGTGAADTRSHGYPVQFIYLQYHDTHHVKDRCLLYNNNYCNTRCTRYRLLTIAHNG